MKYTHDLKDIPKGQHYAVLVPKPVHIPDANDGYGPEIVQAWDYIVFPDKQQWLTYIERETKVVNNQVVQSFIPLGAVPAAVSVEVTVKIQDD